VEKIDQALSDDDFLDIDGFLGPVWKTPNPTLPTDDEPMSATAIPEICDSPKRKADTVDLDESGRVRIHGKAISTSTLTCLTVSSGFFNNIIKPTFGPSDGWNKNLDIMSTRTHFKLPSKQMLAFPGLSETQGERSGQCGCLDYCGHV